MTGLQSAIVTYALSTALLAAYALRLWLNTRKARAAQDRVRPAD